MSIFKRESFRIALLAILLVIGWYTDPTALSIVCVSIGVLTAAAVFSHVVRRIYFPYLDLKKYFVKALEEPLPAAVVVLAVCYLLSTCLSVMTSFLK